MHTLIKNATIINEGQIFQGSVSVKGTLIDKIYHGDETLPAAEREIEAKGSYLIPGVIDDQVHFREPGLTHKGDIFSESRAAIAGGVTTYMEMPNTNPQTTTIQALNDKFNIAARNSIANYSFYMGATNDNLKELLKADPRKVCGIKIFMGSSTGNMLVNDTKTLESIFREVPMLIATHCEDEATIQQNTNTYKKLYGKSMPFRYHPLIRSAEACYKSSSLAVDLATKHKSRLHILHLSTKQELSLLDGSTPLKEKKITGEVCVHHLWFTDADYDKYGSHIKWNPAIKTSEDREALREGLKNNLLDVIATDHAPHTLNEKSNDYFTAPSGGPLVEHALIAMMELANQGVFPKELVVEKMSHAPAKLFGIENRGFIREGYFADLVLISPQRNHTVENSEVHYKCKWTPFAGTRFSHQVTHTFVNGHLAFENGLLNDNKNGESLTFINR
jgi:dihydroorotase